MLKIIGVLFVLCGATGVLYAFVSCQKEKQNNIEMFLIFLEKSIYAMEKENIRVINLFQNYRFSHTCKKEHILEDTLQEISRRLSTHTYGNGQMVWEEVFIEQKEKFILDQETFDLILQSGKGFFGRSKEENCVFLKKSLSELEIQQKKIKQKDAKDRKVWVPVGMLGALMLAIFFL